jgi:CTP synthase (UTP-ammonia lyase)
MSNMNRITNIGIIGDYNPDHLSHQATNAAIGHAAEYLSAKTSVTWLPTPSFLTQEGKKHISLYDAIWVSPKSPYLSLEGAIEAIRLAREMDLPLVGT